MITRRRLDFELVRRGLVTSRQQAQSEIGAGRVTVGGAVADKAARLVAPEEPVVVHGPPPRFVGRGGEKLNAALERFPVEVAGRRALDAGSSTGGFTDCLLQRGAAEVVAVDVGYGQLHGRLRGDPRVRLLERTNVRRLSAAEVDAPFPLVVVDLAFISLRTALPALLPLAGPGADIVALVKPQFESGRRDADRGRGVIRDPAGWLRALEGARAALTSGDAAMMGVMVSPLTGADGNVEFFVHARARTPPTAASLVDLAAVVDEAAHGRGR